MEDVKFEFRLHGVELVEFILSPQQPGTKLGGVFKFDVNVETRLSPERSLVAVFVKVIVKEDDKDNILASITVAVGFEIKDFETIIILKDDGEIVMPFKLENTTRRVAISTTRGVMFAYLKGTYLNKAFLPVLPDLLTPIKVKEKKKN